MIAADRYGVSFLLKQCPNDRLVNPISINNVLDDPVIKAHYFLQDKFYKISENNIEQITQFIIDNNLISQENVFDLIKNFFNCIVGRTQLIPYFIQLIKNLNQFCNFYEEIKTHLHFFIKGFGQNPLINELKSHNIITDNDIEQSTTLESKDTWKNNPGYHPHEQEMAFFIRSFIKEDDVSKLQSYIVSHNVNFNMDSFCEDWPTYSLMTTSPQLIHYSAQCGSIMCFKFLLINGATLQEKFYCHHYCIGNPQLDCLHYAIAGQNIEIIRLVMQHNLHFDESHLKIAIELHNISLFDWIYDSIAQEITEQTIICCFNNFFLYGLKKSFEIDWLRALEISCMNGFTRFSTILLNNKIDSIEYSLFRAFRNSIASCDLLIVKRLYKISFLEISEKIKSDLYSPLLDAIIYLNIPIIKYFLSLEEIGINNDGSGSYAYIQTPLIEAAKSNHTEIIKMLLERSDIDINKHASNRITNCFPFIIIVYNNNKELIDIFLQHPQFKLNKTELDEIMKYKDIDGKIRKKILDFYKHSKEV